MKIKYKFVYEADALIFHRISMGDDELARAVALDMVRSNTIACELILKDGAINTTVQKRSFQEVCYAMNRPEVWHGMIDIWKDCVCIEPVSNRRIFRNIRAAMDNKDWDGIEKMVRSGYKDKDYTKEVRQNLVDSILSCDYFRTDKGLLALKMLLKMIEKSDNEFGSKTKKRSGDFWSQIVPWMEIRRLSHSDRNAWLEEYKGKVHGVKDWVVNITRDLSDNLSVEKLKANIELVISSIDPVKQDLFLNELSRGISSVYVRHYAQLKYSNTNEIVQFSDFINKIGSVEGLNLFKEEVSVKMLTCELVNEIKRMSDEKVGGKQGIDVNQMHKIASAFIPAKYLEMEIKSVACAYSTGEMPMHVEKAFLDFITKHDTASNMRHNKVKAL